MKRTNVRKLTALFAVVTLLAVSVSVISIEVVAHAKPDLGTPLRGGNVPLLRHAHLLGAVSGQRQLDLSVGLALNNQAELNSLLKNLYNPSSPDYHHFLTPAEFAAAFSPTRDQQQQVVDYLTNLGLQVTSVSPNGLIIHARATVSQAEKSFKVNINSYSLGSRKFYANDRAPTIPSSLVSSIVSIQGMDTASVMHPRYLSGSLNAARHLSPRKHNANPAGYGPSDLRGAYDASPLENSSNQGNNQTVALVEFDGYNSSDITRYLSQYGLGSPSIKTVTVDGGPGGVGGGAIEDELDIEVVAAMAPKAAQLIYEAPNSTPGANDLYNQIVTDHKAQVMTTSWGLCESGTGNAELQTLDNIFQQGAAQGISMYAASGDFGAYDCGGTTLGVDSPASDPYVTGTGGTSLQLSNGNYGSESVWSNPNDKSNSVMGVGSGGGLSSLFAKPSWQTGPGVQNGNRQVPDVSADADPNTGYAVYCTVGAAGCDPQFPWIEVGGTSAAAPLWAGSTALINQYLLQQGKSRVGYANPALYGLNNAPQQFTPFHDVTVGNNLFYQAAAGYDMASGWGSPDINNIALDLANGTTPPPTPTPTPTATPDPTPTPTATPDPTPTPTATPDPTPTPTPTATPSPTPNPGSSTIQNGGFENGTAPWVEYSSGGYELIDTTNPHTGNYSAYLCGYKSCNDSIAQSFTVPTGSSAITISYWWYGLTQHTSFQCLDTFKVTIVNSNGLAIGRLQLACNYNATARWMHASFNVTSLLSKYAGKTVTLYFAASTSSSLRTTSFFVDDVALTVSAPGTRPGGGPPGLPPVAPPGSALPVERKDG